MDNYGKLVMVKSSVPMS